MQIISLKDFSSTFSNTIVAYAIAFALFCISIEFLYILDIKVIINPEKMDNTTIDIVKSIPVTPLLSKIFIFLFFMFITYKKS